eukprot:3792936-Prymnesium_polylepis.1
MTPLHFAPPPRPGRPAITPKFVFRLQYCQISCREKQCTCIKRAVHAHTWPMAYDAPCGGSGRYARPA